MIAAAAAVAAGTGLSIMGTLEEGKQAAKMGKLQQRALNEQAAQTEYAGQYEARQKRIEAWRTQQTQIAAMNANGGIISGSNLLILTDTAREYETDASVIARNAKIKANALRFEGAMAKWTGSMARRASRIRAMATGLQSAGMIYLMGSMGGGGGGPAGGTTGTIGGVKTSAAYGPKGAGYAQSVGGSTWSNFAVR